MGQTRPFEHLPAPYTVGFDFCSDSEHAIFEKARELGGMLRSFTHEGPAGRNPHMELGFYSRAAAMQMMRFITPDESEEFLCGALIDQQIVDLRDA